MRIRLVTRSKIHNRYYKIPILSILVVLIINEYIYVQRSIGNRGGWPNDGRNKTRKKMSSKSSKLIDFKIPIQAPIRL